MQTRKVVLVAAQAGSDLEAAATALIDHEFAVHLLHSQAAVLLAIEEGAQLSLIVLDATLMSDHDDMIRRIRDHHRDLPIIWVRQGDDKRRFAGDPPRAVLDAPIDATLFRQTARGVLADDFFPRAIVQGLLSASNAVLALSYEVAVDADTPWLKRTEALPGSVHAYIAFMSEQVSGHLLTSGDLATLCALGERLGLDAAQGQRQVAIDVAGEIGNQILGRMKSICGDILRGVRMGVPVVWMGEHVHAHFSSERPNLAVTLLTELGPIHVNFGFARVQSADPNAGVPDDFMSSGELQLF